MRIDPHALVPLYAQIEQVLVSRMADGSLPSGSRLPSEDSLIERFAVSRTTIRTTIQNLVRRGLVEIRRGKGTFVTAPKVTQELTELTGFVEDMQALGRTATARVLERRLVEANETVARQLELPEGTPVIRLQRIRLADGTPLSLDETYLPRELGEKIVTDDLERHQVFSLLEQKYATPLIEAEYRLEAITADWAVAKALMIKPGDPIFRIERTTYSVDRRPVDYEMLYYRGDHIRFVTRLARRTSSSPASGLKD